MAQQTAIQQLINEIDQIFKGNKSIYTPQYIFNVIRLKCLQKLETEKQQIVNANRLGRCNDCPFMYTNENAEQYYNETYINRNNMAQQTLVAKITRNVSNCFGSHEEEFDKAEVKSFYEALEMCKAVGSFHGMIEQCVEFIEIDTTNMTAEFKVNGRMRYEGDTFTLSVTTKQNDMAQQTAAEWLISELRHCLEESGNIEIIPTLLDRLEVQAKEMEKQQIVKAVNVGFDEGCKFPEDIKLGSGEQYYNETYKKD
jgi:hypothetical protein